MPFVALPVAADAPVYLDPSYSPVERAADLAARMTLPEKASQMNSSQSAAIPRLGIAAYGWWNEAGHGVAREGTRNGGGPPTLINTTSYPVDLSLGSTWNPDLIYREATLISDETREIFRNNTLDLSLYSPTVNLARDPRWGRNDEAFSEDPLLTAALAGQFVNGLQGQTPSGETQNGYLKTIATIKHFAANNSEFNRVNGSSDMDERTLREYYTAQFRDLIRNSSPGSIMSAYNRVNGIPAPASVHLNDTLARQTFGFGGYFTSDCDAVYEIQAGHHWQPANAAAPLDQFGRTAYAQSAGEDLNCNAGYKDGKNYGNTIPAAVAQHITTDTGIYNENDVDVSLVRLLTARIATGEFDAEAQVPWVAAARARLAPGTWTNADTNAAVTETPERLAMAREVAGESTVLLKNDRGLLPLRVPATGAYRVAVIGTYANPPTMYLGGYSSIQGSAGVAKSVTTYAGVRAAVLAANPDATVDYLPASDPAAAAGYDVVIVHAGTDDTTAREAHDRADLALPGGQAELIAQVVAANPRTVVYLETVGQVDLPPGVPAVLWSSYNGQQKGAALADVLTGAVNPSGHLPFTWYADLAQLPPIGDYAIRPTATTLGRTYQYFTGDVTYPFGHGLSYTRFRYGNVRVDRHRVDADGTILVSADVTNVGRTTGADVAQLYVRTPAAADRPKQRLAGFRKITLRPGQTSQVTFRVSVPSLAYFDEAAGRYRVDPGRYELRVADSSAGRGSRANVAVTGTLHAVPEVVTPRPVAVGDAALGISQRVVFGTGSRIDPQLTVSLTDETLAGYRTLGDSTPLPAGMRVRYTSNRPDVVSADLVALQPGVATVTATVDYRGRTARGTFVVLVRG
ncbi:glycoside hydrolase family 3 C-terminal domain-containing protein [Paractinoplanes durhamensis]|uniref:glycoside hydrolase family 3 C-terminal domain-containing protein n=1 Tax=Paractinoplanes durhamensis TaxID=113563 RepID=UPI001EF3CD44|nr:glycoside hydrolase family 3 C-terminal domain-containing protein [Actinoplanes durhamensis]